MAELNKAQSLHEKILASEANLENSEQAKAIDALLSRVHSAVPKNERGALLILRLRADAMYRGGLSDAEGVRHVPEVLDHYAQLRNILKESD